MIYFARVGDRPVIKIGFSANVKQRLRHLTLEHGVPYTPLAVVEGDTGRERSFHRRFAHLRIRLRRMGRSEYFRAEPDLLALIADLTQAEIADKHLLPILEKLYQDGILEEAKRIKGKS